MAIAKLFLVLVSFFLQQYVATAPNVAPTEQLREKRGLEYALPYVMTLAKILSCSWAIFQVSALLALSDYSSRFHPILGFIPTSIVSNPTTFTALTPTFLAGTFLTFAGCLLRGHCFHVLGPRFTFELSIRPSHTLVTKGVYGFVRHPSYTAALVASVGCLLCLLDLQPWLVDACATHIWLSAGDEDCHAMATSALACLLLATFGLLFAGLSTRMDKEDAMLEKNFRKEWQAWARRVPYRLVPGVC